MASDQSVAKLTKTSVESLPRPAPGTRVVLWDLEVKGFGVRVTSAGGRTYVLRYRMGGRAMPLRTFTIGQHGSPWTADQARRRALDLLSQVRSGVDPAAERDAGRQDAEAQAEARAKRMFSALADRWFEQHVKAGGLRSLKDIEGVLERDLKPALMDKTVDELTKEGVSDMLAAIGARSGDAANKALKWLRQMLNWLIDKGVIATSPIDRMKMPFPQGKRTRKLTLMELAIVWVAADELHEPFRSFYQLLILLGQRLREVANLPWSEIDMEEGDWLIPGAAPRTSATTSSRCPIRPWPSCSGCAGTSPRVAAR